ncbi:MAG: AMP-binding protein [Marinilabiliaceae bacterium]|nr:AMP-binding protein [Marinilabiliaceae bacterium]
MLEKYLKQTKFTSYEDFMQNFEVQIPQRFNFGYDIVDEWAKTEPDKPALLWTDENGAERQYSFAEIKHYSDQTASFLQSLGIGHGDMVMLIVKRHVEFWFTIVALHKLGAVVIPATHLLTSKDIIYRTNAAGIKAIVACGDEAVIEHINEAMPDSPSVKHLISIGPIVPEGWNDYQKGIANAKTFVRPEVANENNDIMLLYFTSGTTGEPKMVAHDFTYPLAHIITGKYWHNLDETSLHLTLADTGWGKAVWGKLYGQWFSGANVFVYLYDRFNPADVLKMIEKYHITSFCAPPTVFRFMIREDLSKYNISSLRYCTIAGEALNPKVYDEWLRLTGIKLMEGFGQTETTLTICTLPWTEPKPGSMGKRNPQYDVALLKPDGTYAKAGEQGEIVIRTNGKKVLGLFKEYYRDPERTKTTLHGDLYHTGDVASIDEDGYFWFIGRTDDVIKSSGYRISPFEVESAIMTFSGIVECAVTGVPDEVRGQIIKASIVLSEEYKKRAGEELAKEIQEHVKTITAPYKYPRIIEFVNQLPKTISGKIKRSEIRGDNK